MIDAYKARIAATYDVTQILDVLDMETLDLVDALEERILENLYKFTEVDLGDMDE